MIKLAKPDIQESDIELVKEVLISGNLVQGKNVAQFEKDLCDYIGCSYAKLVSSGTAALHAAGMALGVTPGDKVLVSAFTYPASANVFEAMGAQVDIVDVDSKSYCTNFEILRKHLEVNSGYKAFVLVHEFGYPVETEEISKLCKSLGITLIEDAACALGSFEVNGNHVGKFSDFCCFSFHPRKAITSGEGGLVVTNSEEYHEKITSMIDHGTVRTDDGLKFKYAGLNYRMTDFQAVLGLSQLKRYDSILSQRRKLGALYSELLQNCDGLEIPETPKGSSYQTYMVVLDKDIDRKTLISYLREKNIESNIGAYNLGDLDYYQEKYNFSSVTCPNSNALFERGLALPLHGYMQSEDVNYVCETLREFLCK